MHICLVIFLKFWPEFSPLDRVQLALLNHEAHLRHNLSGSGLVNLRVLIKLVMRVNLLQISLKSANDQLLWVFVDRVDFWLIDLSNDLSAHAVTELFLPAFGICDQ